MARRNLRLGALAVCAAACLAAWVEGRIVTDQEALEEVFDQLIEAVSQENSSQTGALLDPNFAFDGPRPIGRGPRTVADQKLAEFWESASSITYVEQDREVNMEKTRIQSRGHLRFHYQDMLVLYRVELMLQFQEQEGQDSRLLRLHVTELSPGLF
ncbi:MAG: hypothetical protein VX498_11795 [Myxococcota bacterium]|nr:hypothetical protein [Myxococcota bacterium]